MAVVSDDHANPELYNVEHLSVLPTKSNAATSTISAEEVKRHNGTDGSFWAVVEGFVVDATEFIDTHPGGLRKLLSADAAATGATGKVFGFSFSRGRNAHFPDTGKRFHRGVQKFLKGEGSEVAFPPFGKLVILGLLEGGEAV